MSFFKHGAKESMSDEFMRENRSKEGVGAGVEATRHFSMNEAARCSGIP
jgi:hypothetical protein